MFASYAMHMLKQTTLFTLRNVTMLQRVDKGTKGFGKLNFGNSTMYQPSLDTDVGNNFRKRLILKSNISWLCQFFPKASFNPPIFRLFSWSICHIACPLKLVLVFPVSFKTPSFVGISAAPKAIPSFSCEIFQVYKVW